MSAVRKRFEDFEAQVTGFIEQMTNTNVAEKDELGHSKRSSAKAGMVGAAGSVERGSTTSDFDPIERRMQHSLHTSVLHLDHQGLRIHLLDTPGSADCLGQSLPALEAVETAAIVINATSGIEPMAGPLPRNPNGKIDRKLLAAQWHERREAAGAQPFEGPEVVDGDGALFGWHVFPQFLFVRGI